MDKLEAQKLVIKAGHELTESGLIARTWGNVSCRLDDNRFVITPSGRDYQTLVPDEIVPVQIADGSYAGNVKPSSEKGIHAEVYKLYPDINFVIHTHQNQASVISAAQVDSIKTTPGPSELGQEVMVAAYALPGTKKLRRHVSQALSQSKSQAVIMRNHGALCFGSDYQEAFRTAYELEKVCRDYIISQYLKRSGKTNLNEQEMLDFALSLLNPSGETKNVPPVEFQYSSQRSPQGFTLFDEQGNRMEILFNEIDNSLPFEAKLHNAIYRHNPGVNCILWQHTPEMITMSRSGIKVRPLLDDFAQIAGPAAHIVGKDPYQAATALKRSSVVFIRNGGALCCGPSPDEATAVSMVTQKNCQAYLGAALFGQIKPINWLEALLMHFIYQKSYSRQK